MKMLDLVLIAHLYRLPKLRKPSQCLAFSGYSTLRKLTERVRRAALSMASDIETVLKTQTIVCVRRESLSMHQHLLAVLCHVRKIGARSRIPADR